MIILFWLALPVLAASAQEGLIYHGVAVEPGGMNAWVATIETVAVYHTPDFARTWECQEVLTVRDFFDIHFIDSLRGWTCGRLGTIFGTSDGGASWAQQNLGGPKFATRIRFLDDTLGWAASGEASLLKTTDGGAEWSWQIFPNPPFPVDTCDFQGVWFTDPQHGWLAGGRYPTGDTFTGGQGYIVRTHSGGDSWQVVRLDTVYDFYDVHFFDEDRGVVVGGDDSDMSAVVLLTTDAGENWSEASVPAEAKFLRGLKFVGEKGWACGRSGTVIHSSDGGMNWVLQRTRVDTTLFDIDFGDSMHGMIAGNSVVLFTTNGGRHWERGYGGVQEPRKLPALSGRRLVVIQSDNEVRFQVNGVTGMFFIRLFDATGRQVALLFGSEQDTPSWDGRDAGSGPYFAVLSAGRHRETARFVNIAAGQ
ncbi:MAG: hypothetical protein JSU73_00290 [candidate division WOR-3 bacterium]|nr:MAG: hypothetical protein JSU73_00290 [candidate division WOR-3 bacterium]